MYIRPRSVIHPGRDSRYLSLASRKRFSCSTLNSFTAVSGTGIPDLPEPLDELVAFRCGPEAEKIFPFRVGDDVDGLLVEEAPVLVRKLGILRQQEERNQSQHRLHHTSKAWVNMVPPCPAERGFWPLPASPSRAAAAASGPGAGQNLLVITIDTLRADRRGGIRLSPRPRPPISTRWHGKVFSSSRPSPRCRSLSRRTRAFSPVFFHLPMGSATTLTSGSARRREPWRKI